MPKFCKYCKVKIFEEDIVRIAKDGTPICSACVTKIGQGGNLLMFMD